MRTGGLPAFQGPPLPGLAIGGYVVQRTREPGRTGLRGRLLAGRRPLEPAPGNAGEGSVQ